MAAPPLCTGLWTRRVSFTRTFFLLVTRDEPYGAHALHFGVRLQEQSLVAHRGSDAGGAADGANGEYRDLSLVTTTKRQWSWNSCLGSLFVISRSRIGWFVLVVIGIIIAAFGSVALT